MPKEEEGATITVEPTVISETQPIDTSAALAEISNDLFGQGEDGGERDKSVERAETAAPAAGEPAAPPVEENSAEVQAIGAPKTWSKEAIADWASIPEKAKSEILKREEDMHRGLEDYKGRATIGDAYTKVVEPYAPLLEQAGIDPVTLFQNFAGNHYLLSKGTPEQKLSLAANLLQNYNIDIIELATHLGNMPALDPETQALRAELAQARAALGTRQKADLDSARNSISSQIEAFAADPKNVYFAELSDDIARLFETGGANSLQEAYDKAIYLNPVTRQKEVDRLTAERLAANQTEADRVRQKNALAAGADVSTRPNARDGTVPLGSMDDTMEETLAAIKARG